MARAPISKERLNQIARRKLEALGISVGLSRDGKTLVGVIPVQSGAMINPASGESIEEIRFAVEGHDHLRLLAPPSLRELLPQPFYDFDRAALLLTRIAEQLARRFSAAREYEARLRARQIPARIDAARIVAQGQVDLGPSGKVLLEGSARGLFATQAKRPGSPKPLRLREVPIDLDEFPDRSDFDLSLARWVEEAVTNPLPELPEAGALDPGFVTGERPLPTAQAPTAPGAEGSPAPPTLGAVMPTLAKVEAGASGAPGLGVRLETIAGRIDPDLRVLTFTGVKELMVGGERLRFSIEQRGEVFVGKLQRPGEVLWEEPIDLITFPGVAALVTRITGETIAVKQPLPAVTRPAAGSAPSSPAGAAPASAPAPAPAPRASPLPVATQIELPTPPSASVPSGLIPAHALPIKGERWVLDVRVVKQEGGSMHYATVDAQGQTQGAAQVLPEASFRAAFIDLGGGSHRLRVEVMAVEAERILYRQLDPAGGPVGSARPILPQVFVATFLPEAGAY